MSDRKTPKEAQPTKKIWLTDIIGKGCSDTDFSEDSIDELVETIVCDIKEGRVRTITDEDSALIDAYLEQSLSSPDFVNASEATLRQMAEEEKEGEGKEAHVVDEERAEIDAFVKKLLSSGTNANLGKFMRSLTEKKN